MSRNDDVHVPGDFNLAELLERIDEKITMLALVQEGVELNQQTVDILARRFTLQQKSLDLILKELQTLVMGLHALAARKRPDQSMQ